jgi:hypothetical protein
MHTRKGNGVLNKVRIFMSRLFLSIILIILFWLGWKVAHGHYYKSGDGLGYNLGLFGGLMMLTLLLYSFRKHIKFMQGLGKLKHWFRIHMILGVLGPTLVLFHTTFRTGSMNATVALYCMLLVAGSGLIGRFIYTRIHKGLYGSRSTLKSAHEELAGNAENVKSNLNSFPNVQEWIGEFEHEALEGERNFLEGIWYFLSFDIRRMILMRRCKLEIRLALASTPGSNLSNDAINSVQKYLIQIQSVAQFKKFEQIFSAWHILHLPFMYMMVATAIFHVIWVHMY